MDPFRALAEFVLGKLKASAVAQWMKLIFQLVFSAVCTFLFVTGSALVAVQLPIIGVGSGMVSAAIVMVVIFRCSPLTKGMIAVLPSAEATQEIHSDLQIISK